MDKKSISRILILVVFAAVVGGGILVWQYWPSWEQNPIPRPTSNSGWETYKSEKYGFSFRYPEEVNFGKGLTKIYVGENLNPINAIFVVYIEEPFTVGFQFRAKPENFSNLESYVKDTTESINKIKDSATPIFADFSEIKIGGINGFIIKTSASDVLANTDADIYFQNPNYLIVIRYSYSQTLLENNDPVESLKYETIQKVISTFKFI